MLIRPKLKLWLTLHSFQCRQINLQAGFRSVTSIWGARGLPLECSCLHHRKKRTRDLSLKKFSKFPFINLLAYICEHVLLWCCSSTVLTVFTLLSSCPRPSQTPTMILKNNKNPETVFPKKHTKLCCQFYISSLFLLSYLSEKQQISSQISFSCSESGLLRISLFYTATAWQSCRVYELGHLFRYIPSHPRQILVVLKAQQRLSLSLKQRLLRH